MGTSWVDNKSRAVEGSVDAITVTKRGQYNYDKYNVPEVHPKIGRTPPFYSHSYCIVSDWTTYKTIIESDNNIIVVNVHGEVIPVPSGYGGSSWLDKIAEAMLNRSVIWVNIAGYPFYYGWHQGATEPELWKENGLQQVFAHISLSVSLPHFDGSVCDGLSDEARNALELWKIEEGSYIATRDRPFPSSIFKSYLILPIWGDRKSNYYTGAVVAFVKPNERFSPNTRKFGAFVHLGTNKIYSEGGIETDKDYWRAYMGVAAAVWTATTGFHSATASSRYDPGDVNFTIHVAPAILEYNWWSTTKVWEIHIGFFVYGALKRPYYSSITVDKIGLYVKPEIPDFEGSYSITPFPDLSRNAYPSQSTMYTDNGLIMKSIIFGFSLFDPTQITKVVSGVLLFSDWITTITYADNSPNDQQINIEFYVDTYTTPAGDYDIIEFQSIFAVSLKIYEETGIGNREGWRIIPIHWGAQLIPTGVAWSNGPITGDIMELAAYFSRSEEYTATIFFDDFKDFELAEGEYSAGDVNSDSGTDTWGTMDSLYSFEGTPSFPAGKCLWCAAQGRNSLNQEKPNIEVGEYDKDMEAFLIRYVDLKPYKQAWLFYLIDVYNIELGDYLEVYVTYTNNTSTLVDSITSSTYRHWRTIELENTVKSLKFIFHSDHDNAIGGGAIIYYLEIRAAIPNDAERNQDAGDNIDTPTTSSKKEFSGYLDDEDWYLISIFPASNQNTSFQITSPENAIFKIELYNTANEKIAGPSERIELKLSTGNYKIRIYSLTGFGQYKFKIEYIDTGGGHHGGGGGGCPTRLFRK